MSPGDRTGLSESGERAVRAELDRLLASTVFRTSKRSREFLQYIVEHTIRGPSDSLKERSIGVELFQLPPDFDTGQHTVVRVSANEVRKRLAQHYLAENGSPRPVRIELPPGSYSAEFRWETPAAEPQLPARRNVRLRLLIACALSVVVIAAGSALWQGRGVESDARQTPPAPISAAVANAPPSEELRMIVGGTSPYVDRSGRTWAPDRFFTGGTLMFRPSQRILRTLDPDIYRHVRLGEFRYDIPLAPGSYELRLHFAETGLADFISAESSGEGQRVFRVTANDKRILDLFDVVADAAGANIATIRVFRDISPAQDGLLHLSFTSLRATAMLSGIEVLPVRAAKVRPLRIRAGWTSSWHDSAGQEWEGDSYFLGGNALVRTTNPAQAGNSIAHDTALYTSERWGHFSYALPVAEGRYRLTLKFCEGHYGRRNTGIGGIASRVFDVYCNGVALLKDFDIIRQAGGEGLPVERSFSGIRANAQGKIVLTFVPVKGMACVNGIEVVEDSK